MGRLSLLQFDILEDDLRLGSGDWYGLALLGFLVRDGIKQRLARLPTEESADAGRADVGQGGAGRAAARR